MPLLAQFSSIFFHRLLHIGAARQVSDNVSAQ